jgi:hypothetical protein
MTTIILMGLGGIAFACIVAIAFTPSPEQDRHQRAVHGNDPKTVKGINGERWARPK